MNKNVTSKDGTRIAFEQTGSGPAVILVSSALSDRTDTNKLAKLLAENFTVLNYDRRGRGESSDKNSYAIEREIEDIDALIGAVGGSAYLFGSSSGAALALDAANALGNKVSKQVVYEPPFIIDGSRPPVAPELIDEISELVAANRNSDAVKTFMNKVMGIPAFGVFAMRLMPGWSKMSGMARTTVYDLTILKGTQDGKPLPANRWSAVKAPTLVLTGEKSEEFFHKGGAALAKILPNAQHRILKGMHHGSVMMAPPAFADIITKFFKA